MPSVPPRVSLAATVALAALLLAGCGAGDNDAAGDGGAAAPAAATSAKPAGTPENNAAAVVYRDPMEIAEKIRAANLDCPKPVKDEPLEGVVKVTCGGDANITIDFYDDPRYVTEVRKFICELFPSGTYIAAEEQHWLVTTLDKSVTKRVQQVIGGEIHKVC